MRQTPFTLKDLEDVRLKVMKSLHPIVTSRDDNYNFGNISNITNAGKSLPPYFLCYFLFVDLLQFKHWGRGEKVAWSIPISYMGEVFLLEDRKTGLVLLSQKDQNSECLAEQIVKKIKKSVKIAKSYFDGRARAVVKTSNLNVSNYNAPLYGRFQYFRANYAKIQEQIETNPPPSVVVKSKYGSTISFPVLEMKKEAEWLALSVVDSFFNWTEHLFILISILKCILKTGEDVANFSSIEWAEKFKIAVNIDNDGCKKSYDQLIAIRRNIRNHIAHGSIGKNGETFKFHSGAGAVPILFNNENSSNPFTFNDKLSFNGKEIIQQLDGFVKLLWCGDLEPALIYIDSGLPLILSMTIDGTYQDAMESSTKMEKFIHYLSLAEEQCLNMDW